GGAFAAPALYCFPTRRASDLDFYGGGGDWDAEDQQRLVAAVPGAISRVEDLIHRLDEKKADLGEPTLAPRAAFQGRKLNPAIVADRKSTRLNSSHVAISYAVF